MNCYKQSISTREQLCTYYSEVCTYVWNSTKSGKKNAEKAKVGTTKMYVTNRPNVFWICTLTANCVMYFDLRKRQKKIWKQTEKKKLYSQNNRTQFFLFSFSACCVCLLKYWKWPMDWYFICPFFNWFHSNSDRPMLFGSVYFVILYYLFTL